MINAQPKPSKTRKQVKARAQRAESRHAQQVRAQCVERDGDCRLIDHSLWLIFGACSGEAQWSHMKEARRSKTRGMDPAVRHSTLTSLMLCEKHHDMLDKRGPRPWMQCAAATSRGADGPLGFQIRDTVYVEAEK